MSLETQVNVRFNTSEANKATAEVNKLEASLTRVENVGSELGGPIGDSFSSIASGARGLITPLGAIGAALAGIGAAATVTIGQLRQINDGLIDLAARTGRSVEELDQLRSIAILNGADFNNLSGILERVNKQAGQAAAGNKKLTDTFKQLGIDVQSFSSLSTIDQITAINAGLSRISDSSQRAAIQQRLLGRTSQDFLDIGINGYRQLEEAQRIGLGTSKEQFELAARQDEAFNKISASLSGLGNSLTQVFGPATVKLIEDVATAINTVSAGISKYKDEVKLTADILNNLNSPTQAAAAITTYYANEQIKAAEASKETGLGVSQLGSLFGILKTSVEAATEAGIKETEARKRAKEEKDKETQSVKNLTEAKRQLYGMDLTAIAQMEEQQFLQDIQIQKNEEQARLTEQLAERNLYLADTYGQIMESFDPYLAATNRAKDEQALLNEALAAGAINAEQYAQAVGLIKDEQEKLKANKFFENLGLSLDGLANGFGDAFVDSLERGKDAWKDFLKDLAQQLLKSAVSKLITQLALSLVPGGGGAAGGINAAVSGNNFGGTFAKGGTFDGPITTFSNGGIVGTPTKFFANGGVGLMGEAGPEFIAPLKRGRDGKLGVSVTDASRGGGSTYVINNNVTVQGGDNADETAAATSRAIDQLMERKILSVLKDQSRSGNSLSPATQMY